MIDLERILQQARTLVVQVGDFIRKESMVFSVEAIELKGFNDLVSYVDKQSEMKLVEGCRKILPEAGFITEEGTATDKDENYKWVIDPLDGTTNFTHGLPVYAISVALLRGDKIVLGIVYEINRDECFYATENSAAFLNGKIITVSSASHLSESLLATGFPYSNFAGMSKYLGLLNEFMQSTHGLRRMGSAAVDLAYVACGRFEGFFEYNLNSWDVAAGALLVRQAGGHVTDFRNGNNYLFGKEILAAGAIHNEMLNVIQKHWA